ncbi:MAG: class I SAM-dependent RNA methyltransferase [Candidatus Competibacteraceae bacterium]
MKLPPETAAGLRAGCEIHCPGCAHRRLSALESEARKEHWLKQQLSPWQERFATLRAVQGEDRWGYRDRVRLSARWQDACWQFGLMVRKELIAIPHCPIHSERVRAMLALLATVLPPGPVFPLAFFIQAMAQVTLVLKTAKLPELGWVDERFKENLASLAIEGLWLHLHPAAGRRMFAKNGWQLLWGRPYSIDDGGLRYGPTAFQQVLPALYRQALAEAEAFLAPIAEDLMIDLYSGGGASLVRWSKCGADAVGVELGGEAVECARHNAPHALLLRGKCADRIPQLEAWLDHHAGAAGRRLLYVNPPRTGLEPEVLAWVVGSLRPERLAYLSCSAGTLRRDLDVLIGSNYRVERITPYDFFPQTYHVETLVLLREDQG